MKYYEDERYMAIVNDLLAMPTIQKLKQYEQHHYESRLEHVINVSYLSYRVARIYGLDAKSVARAGILHDLFFYSWHDNSLTMKEHAYMHPRIALENAKEITDVSELEEEIILTHMYPVGGGQRPHHLEAWLVDSVDDYLACKEGISGSVLTFILKYYRRQILSVDKSSKIV